MKHNIKLLVMAAILGSSLFTTACQHGHHRNLGMRGNAGMQHDRMSNRWKPDNHMGQQHRGWRNPGDRRW